MFILIYLFNTNLYLPLLCPCFRHLKTIIKMISKIQRVEFNGWMAPVHLFVIFDAKHMQWRGTGKGHEEGRGEVYRFTGTVGAWMLKIASFGRDCVDTWNNWAKCALLLRLKQLRALYVDCTKESSPTRGRAYRD